MNESVNIVCAHCTTVNRVPLLKLGDKANCGKCKQPLFNAQALELSSANFIQHIQRSGIPILIDFWAPWCGPCKAMAPAIAQAAVQLEPAVRVAKLNTETEPAIASQYAIRSIPTLILFINGREITRQSGALDANSLVNWTRSHLN